MDSLEILKKAERLGGEERKKVMLDTFIRARQIGCTIYAAGGKVGGFNVRYGSLKYAIMDMNTRGEIFLHLKPHPNKEISDELRTQGNTFVDNLPGVTIKNSPINHFGQTVEKIEEIGLEPLETFIEYAVEIIRENYYRPHTG